MGFHEKLRLLYVACTRARDHLVVSVHRKARELARRADRSAGRTPSCCGTRRSTAHWVATLGAPRPTVGVVAGRAGAAPALELDGMGRRARRRVRDAAAGARSWPRPRSRIASTPQRPHDPGLAKDARDLELPPWNKGRYGTAIGRAVHAVCRRRPRDRRGPRRATAAAQAAAEGVLGHEATIAALARGRARERDASGPRAAGQYWRETYVAVPLDGITLEGYVDLVYRDDDGLVVVDYKTDAVARRRARRAGSRTTGSRPRRTRSRSRTRRANRSTAACCASSTPTARTRSSSRATSSPPRSTRSAACSRPSATTRSPLGPARRRRRVLQTPGPAR